MSPRDRTRPVTIGLALIAMVGGSILVDAFVNHQIEQHRAVARSGLRRRSCVEASCKQASVVDNAQALVPAGTGSLPESTGH